MNGQDGSVSGTPLVECSAKRFSEHGVIDCSAVLPSSAWRVDQLDAKSNADCLSACVGRNLQASGSVRCDVDRLPISTVDSWVPCFDRDNRRISFGSVSRFSGEGSRHEAYASATRALRFDETSDEGSTGVVTAITSTAARRRAAIGAAVMSLSGTGSSISAPTALRPHMMHHLIVSARKALCFDQLEDTPSVAGTIGLTSRPPSFGSSAKGDITPLRRPVGGALGSRSRPTSFGSSAAGMTPSAIPAKVLSFEETPATPVNDSFIDSIQEETPAKPAEDSIQEQEDEDESDEGEVEAQADRRVDLTKPADGTHEELACTSPEGRRLRGRGSPCSAGAVGRCRTPCSAIRAARTPCSGESQRPLVVRRRYTGRRRRLSLGGACCVRPGGSGRH